MWRNMWISLLLLPLIKGQRLDCSRSGYERCVAIADPLVKEAHLIFPDNLDDIDLVCRTWNRFVDCLKSYTEDCFTEAQRRAFNRAVESPIESVHEMCMQPSYQKEYLRYASCIKSTVIERDHCGPHYNLLVDQVEQGDVISKSTLCCSHDRFKDCVQKETRRLCDQGIPDGPAFRFATQTIDKALRFLQDQCVNYIPNAVDCAPLLDALRALSDRSSNHKNVIPAPSEVYPWSSIQQDPDHGRQESKDDIHQIPVSRGPKISTSSWLPNSNLPTKNELENSISTASTNANQHLGPRIRPSSYGRASSWPADNPSSATPRNTQNYQQDNPNSIHHHAIERTNIYSSTNIKTYGATQNNGPQSSPISSDHVGNSDGTQKGQKSVVNTVPSLAESGSSSTPFTNKWGTIEIVDNPGTNSKLAASGTTPTAFQQDYSTSSSTSSSVQFSTPAWYPTSSPETWYPAAGFQLNNEVDEPNQMGLIKPENNSGVSAKSSWSVLVASLVWWCFWLKFRNT